MSSASQPAEGIGRQLICDECQKPFDTERGLRTHLGMVHGTKIADRICAECKEPFPGKPTRKYCSPDCSRKARRNRVSVECDCCYKQFETRQSWYNRYESHYCGDRCNGIADRTYFGDGDKLRRDTRPNTFRELVRHAYVYEGHSFEATCRIIDHELDDNHSREEIDDIVSELMSHERNVRNRVWALRPEDLGLSPIGEVAQ